MLISSLTFHLYQERDKQLNPHCIVANLFSRVPCFLNQQHFTMTMLDKVVARSLVLAVLDAAACDESPKVQTNVLEMNDGNFSYITNNENQHYCSVESASC